MKEPRPCRAELCIAVGLTAMKGSATRAGLWQHTEHRRRLRRRRTLPTRGSCPTEQEMVVSGPRLSDSGTLPSPYSLYRYFMMASLSRSCLPAKIRWRAFDMRTGPLEVASTVEVTR